MTERAFFQAKISGHNNEGVVLTGCRKVGSTVYTCNKLDHSQKLNVSSQVVYIFNILYFVVYLTRGIVYSVPQDSLW